MAIAKVVTVPPLQAEIRSQRGSRKSQNMRAKGQIPAIVYGRGQEAVTISLPTVATKTAITSGLHIFDLVIAGKSEKVLLQDVQYCHLQIEIEHVDFLRVDPNQKVKVKVPLDFRGTPKGVKDGGILETPITELELEVLVTAIPHEIRVVVDTLEIHGIIHAKDIALPEGAKLVNPPEQIVAQVRTIKDVTVEGETKPGEPELIRKPGADEADAKGGAAKAAAPAAKAPAKK